MFSIHKNLCRVCEDKFIPTNMMCRISLLVIITSFHVHLLASQESVHYLQSAIRQLKNMKARQSLARMDRRDFMLDTLNYPAQSHRPAKVSQRKRDQHNIPQLSLTKGELSAIYEAALAKGETVKLDTGDDTIMAAAVHEIDDSIPDGTMQQSSSMKYETDPSNDVSGYYYYYYPIKSFIDEMTSQPHVDQPVAQPTHSYAHHTTLHQDTTIKPQFQYHSHAHQHTVNITALKTMLEGDKKPKKGLEPLFMAISGFIGMAVMFVLSVLVLPKFKISTKKSVKKTERFGDLAKIALQAIEKQDCAERLACELGKTARTFNLGNNRFVKLLKRLAPGTFGRHINKVENYSNKRFKCTAIPCKKKGNQKPKPNKNPKKKH